MSEIYGWNFGLKRFPYVWPRPSGMTSSSDVRTSGGAMPLKDDDCGEVRGILKEVNDEKPMLYHSVVSSPQRYAREGLYVRLDSESDPLANQHVFTVQGVAGSFGSKHAGLTPNRNTPLSGSDIKPFLCILEWLIPSEIKGLLLNRSAAF